MGNGDALALRQLQPLPRGLRQNGFVMPDQIAGHLIECSNHLLGLAAQEYAGVGSKALGAANLTFLVHEDDCLVTGVDAEASGTNTMRRGRPANVRRVRAVHSSAT